MKQPNTPVEPQPLPLEPNDNPWYADQKQIMPTPKLPGWLSLILLAPFRLAYGLSATFAALHQATGGSVVRRSLTMDTHRMILRVGIDARTNIGKECRRGVRQQ